IVLFGYMSLNYVEANQNEYSPVSKSQETITVFLEQLTAGQEKWNLSVDLIDWYEGEEANKIFQAIEQDPEMTEAPDGYYIVNEQSELQTYEISPQAKVYMQIYNRTGNADEAEPVWNEEISLQLFHSLFNSEDEVLHIRDFPYHLETQNGQIVKITQ